MARERSYQAYHYLNDNLQNGLNPGEQYIIVQNSSIINDKKDLENVSCPVYDVNSQQYFINLDATSGQVQQMPVNSEQTEITTNLYENNFILSDAAVGMIQELQGERDCNNLKQINQVMDVDKDKEFNGYAQIALSDEQYQVLQQKGWILLEIADKVFLLDSSGLHDVTGDPNLIKKLKDTSQMISMNSQQSRNNKSVVCNFETSHKQAETSENDCSTKVQNKSVQALQNAKNIRIPATSDSIVQNKTLPISTKKKKQIKANNDHCKILIHSTFELKDIRKEVVLGKTIDGKKLIARVIKGKGIIKEPRKPKRANKNSVDMEPKDFVVSEEDFAKLVENVLLGAIKSNTEDNAAASTVVAELLEMPEYESSLPEHMLIVTKTIREFNEQGIMEKQHGPTIITGRVLKDQNKKGFVHIPYLLQAHMMKNNNSENKHQKECTDSNDPGIHTFVHINISETRTSDNITRVSVTVHKRYLTLTIGHIDQIWDTDSDHKCSSCLREFKTQRELQNHQELPCSGGPWPVNIDKCYSVLRPVNNDTIIFVCNLCKKKISDRKDCHSHLLTHYSEPVQEETSVAKYLESFSEDAKQKDMFICKLCAKTFEEFSTLTKHILVDHINHK